MGMPGLVAVLGCGYTGMQVASELRKSLPAEVTILVINSVRHSALYEATYGGTGIRVCGLSDIANVTKDEYDQLDAMERRFAIAAQEPDRRSDLDSRLTLAFESQDELKAHVERCAEFGVSRQIQVLGNDALLARCGPIAVDRQLFGAIVEEAKFDTGRALRRMRAGLESLVNTYVWSPKEPVVLRLRGDELTVQLDVGERSLPAVVIAAGAGTREVLDTVGVDWPGLRISKFVFFEATDSLGVSGTLVKRIGERALISSRDPRWTRVLPLRPFMRLGKNGYAIDVPRTIETLPMAVRERLELCGALEKFCSIAWESHALFPKAHVIFPTGVAVITPRATFSTDAAILASNVFMRTVVPLFNGKKDSRALQLRLEEIPDDEFGFPRPADGSFISVQGGADVA